MSDSLMPFSTVKEKPCAKCGAMLACGQTELNGGCWCQNIPVVLTPDPSKDCFCPVCLNVLGAV